VGQANTNTTKQNIENIENYNLIIIFFTCHTFDRQGPHFCNSK